MIKHDPMHVAVGSVGLVPGRSGFQSSFTCKGLGDLGLAMVSHHYFPHRVVRIEVGGTTNTLPSTPLKKSLFYTF